MNHQDYFPYSIPKSTCKAPSAYILKHLNPCYIGATEQQSVFNSHSLELRQACWLVVSSNER